MKKIFTKTFSLIILSSILLISIAVFTQAKTTLAASGNMLIKTPSQIQNLDVRNPGNLPFVHDDEISDMNPEGGRYGTISNESGYIAFGKALEFAIATLIKLVGVMCLFGITEGLIRLIVGHGNEEVYGKGIKMIMWSLVGLVLSLIAHAVVTGALQFLTGIGSLDL